MRRHRPPPPPPLPTNHSVFFSGVPLNMSAGVLRPFFESVGRVLELRLLGPSPGKDFRYGEVDYADEQTAQEAIRRLNGHVFGERALRVSLVDMRYKNKRLRREPNSGARHAPPAPPPPPSTDDKGRPLMQFSKGFFDPVLGREDSMVLDVLKSTAKEDAYEAVEQLRVMAVTRPEDARRLLQENPPLVSAVIMIMQHSRRIPFGPLPPEAFDESTSIASPHPVPVGSTTSSAGPEEGAAAGKETGTTSTKSGSSSSSPSNTGTGTGGDGAPAISVTPEQKEQAIESIKKMRNDEVERIMNLTEADLLKVSNVSQRRQLQVLQQCLFELAKDL